MSNYSSIKGAVAASLLGVSVGLPWLFSYSYSLGYDLTLWIYNGWYIKETLLNGVIPNWSNLSASGQPFFKMSGLADGVLVAVFMEIFGLSSGVQIFMCALYVLAAVGFYKMFFYLKPCRISALTASGAYILSWFITFTANFQAYISNFFIYALLPYFVLCAFRLVKKFSIEVFLISAAILACVVLSNPQVAIKVGLIALIAIAPFLHRDRLLKEFGVVLGICLVALLLTMFDIVSALRLREEVVTANDRSNGYTSPFSLIAIPAFLLSFTLDYVVGIRWPEVTLNELLYSKYPGLFVVLLSLIALNVQGSMRQKIRVMWAIVLITYGVFFLVMPHIPATPWVGTSHNLLIIPTFFMSVLAGFGTGTVVDLWVLGKKKKPLIVYSIISLGCIELGCLLLGLRFWGATKTAPDELPQVAMWSDLAQDFERRVSVPRFLSLYPNHSTNLYPVFTGLPTANVIELRQRLPEYQSYLDLIRGCSKNGNCTQPISHLLAPLNVGYVDVPFMFFSYRGPVRAQNNRFDYEEFVQRVFDGDPNLSPILTRVQEREDLRLNSTSTNWSPLNTFTTPQETRTRLAQVIYRNTIHYTAKVAEGAIAIIGAGLEPEKKFEEVVLLPEYQPGRFVFILAESLSDLDANMLKLLKGTLVLRPGGTIKSGSFMNIEDVRSLYSKPIQSVPTVIDAEQGAEHLTIRLNRPVKRDYFLFVSQQYFSDWQAMNDQGDPLALFKVGGGLTGAFIQTGTQEIKMQYKLPTLERIARWVSILAFVGLVITIINARAKAHN